MLWLEKEQQPICIQNFLREFLYPPTPETPSMQPSAIPHFQVPLQQHPVTGGDNRTTLVEVHTPFNTADLLNWKTRIPKICDDHPHVIKVAEQDTWVHHIRPKIASTPTDDIEAAKSLSNTKV